MNPLTPAIRGKGFLALLRRASAILRRYGLGRSRMEGALTELVKVLRQFDCSATLPITGLALARNSALVRKAQAQGIEFAVHGYRHIDHTQLSQAEQLAHLARAWQVFEQAGIRPTGFRCPYLRWNPATLAALRQQGFAYDSSPALAWDVTNGRETSAYRRVLSFYGARPAEEVPSLPFLEVESRSRSGEDLVCIPYSLPDDEALVERLALRTAEEMGDIWLAILRRVYELGELFTLGLHPERASLCLEPLIAVLTQARSLSPPVWIARLDEINAWWRARTEAVVEITDLGDGGFRLGVAGPSGTTVLARAVEVDVPSVPWAGGYERIEGTWNPGAVPGWNPEAVPGQGPEAVPGGAPRPMTFTARAVQRPFVGLAPGASPKMAAFLRQQGYLVEGGAGFPRPKQSHLYPYYFDQAEFAVEDERPLLAQIEGAGYPLLRLGRWPYGARCALAITGDIDALTLWDFLLRFLGR